MGDVFAVDFSWEGMTAAFVDENGVSRDEAGFDLSDFLAGETGAMEKLTALLAAKARMSGGQLDAMSLTMPCDMDLQREKVVNFPQAAWLNGRPLPSIMRDILGVPVIMERRSVTMLAFDMMMLGLPTESLAIGCYIDMQYNVAIWHKGVPVLGHNGRAGNIMHLSVHGREDHCFCGKIGCVGLYGTGVRLQQLHSMIFPDTPRDQLFKVHGDHPIVLDFLQMMAYPIAMAVNYSDPDYLILGGEILGMPGFPRKYLGEEIEKAIYQPGDEGTKILPSTTGEMASGVVCGAQYARMKLAKQL